MGYLRLIRKHGAAQDKETERAGLSAQLDTIPRLTKVASLRDHPKGGYRVDCTIDTEHFDSVITALECEGWMSAI